MSINKSSTVSNGPMKSYSAFNNGMFIFLDFTEKNATWISSTTVVFNMLMYYVLFLSNRKRKHKSKASSSNESVDFASKCCRIIYTPKRLERRKRNMTRSNTPDKSSWTCQCVQCCCISLMSHSSAPNAVDTFHNEESHIDPHIQRDRIVEISENTLTRPKFTGSDKKTKITGPLWLIKVMLLVEISIQTFICIITSRIQLYFNGITWCRLYKVLNLVLYTYLHWLESLLYTERVASLYKRREFTKQNRNQVLPRSNVHKYFSTLRLKIGFFLFAVITTVLAHNYIGVLRFLNGKCTWLEEVYYFYKLFLIPITFLFKEFGPICVQTVCYITIIAFKVFVGSIKPNGNYENEQTTWFHDDILDKYALMRLHFSLLFRYPCVIKFMLNHDFRVHTLVINIWKSFIVILATLMIQCYLLIINRRRNYSNLAHPMTSHNGRKSKNERNLHTNATESV